MVDLFNKLDALKDEISEIVLNRNLDYIDDLDMINSDIDADWDNDIFEDMHYEELKNYVDNVENVLNEYKKYCQ